jgi:hypothetical protein
MKYIITFILLILFLSACAAQVTPAPSAAASAPAPSATPFAPVSAEELNALIADITVKMQQAVEEADPVNKIRFETSQRAQVAADMFARSLTDAENPADRVLDPKSFSIGISPDGIAYLILEVDSIWGKAHEVAIIDTGTDKAMFVTLAGSGLDRGQLSLNEKGYYAAAKDGSGQIVAVVDNSRQWVAPDKAEKIQRADVTRKLAEAYLDGRIAYPKGLTAEEQVAFDSIVAEAEAKLPYEQQKKLIEDRFEKGSKAFEALVKADGNLEYYDGRWKTLEAMRNLNGELIPWGESYDLASEEGQRGLLTNFMAGGHPEAMDGLNKMFNNRKKILNEEGFAGDDFNIRYVQFFPNQNRKILQLISPNMSIYGFEGQMVVKNSKNKIFVIEVKVNTGVFTATNVMSGKTMQLSSRRINEGGDITLSDYHCLAGIPTSHWLDYKYGGLSELATEPAEYTYLENLHSFNLDNFFTKLETDPSSINEVIYQFNYLITIEKQ